jgi:hypothetical protein
MNNPRSIESLSAAELEVIATLWRRERREFVTSFTGTSMLPAITPGQEVLVECGVEPAVGDVAVFRRDDQIGVHRVVARTETWLLTWGDANSLPDLPIVPNEVIGLIRRVSAAPRSLRRALLLRLFAPQRLPMGRLSRRIRFAYSSRAAWALGPLAFARKVLQVIFRPRLPC